MIDLNVKGYLDFTSVTESLTSTLPALLKDALGDRVTTIVCQTKEIVWCLDEQPEKQSSFTLYCNSVYAPSLKAVIMGPSPQDIEASKKFTTLWGQKAEIRRFKDGSIKNSVVYETGNSVEERSLVLPKMISDLIKLHTQSTVINSTLQETLNSYLIHPFTRKHGNFRACQDAYRTLTKVMSDLDLPLNSVNVLQTSDALKYSSVFAPEPDLDTFQPIDIILEFEQSGKWPDNYSAIQEMKIAFYLKIVKELGEKFVDIDASISEDIFSCKSELVFMDIRVNGFLFRCRIHCQREQMLLKSQPKALSMYNKKFNIIPVLSNLISGVCLGDPILGNVMRVCKRFFGAHMLSTQIPSLVIELIVYYAMQKSTFGKCNSVLGGFMRVLYFIKHLDWMNTPVIVLFEASYAIEKQITDTFMKIRNQTGKSMKQCIFIGTKIDMTCDLWECSPMIAHCLVKLCQLAFDSISNDQSVNVTLYTCIS